MKHAIRLLTIPFKFLLALLNLVCALFGSILFRALTVFAGLTAICTIWAWLIGDKMALLFTGITIGTCALLLAGMLLGEKSASILDHFLGRDNRSPKECQKASPFCIYFCHPGILPQR